MAAFQAFRRYRINYISTEQNSRSSSASFSLKTACQLMYWKLLMLEVIDKLWSLVLANFRPLSTIDTDIRMFWHLAERKVKISLPLSDGLCIPANSSESNLFSQLLYSSPERIAPSLRFQRFHIDLTVSLR